MMHIYSYNNNSKSARLLCNALGIKMIKHEESNFKGRPDKFVINWGSRELPQEVRNSTVLNRTIPKKVDMFKILNRDGYILLPFTESRMEAENWEDDFEWKMKTIKDNDGNTLYVRDSNDEYPTILRNHVVEQSVKFTEHLRSDMLLSLATKTLIDEISTDILGTLGLNFGAVTIGVQANGNIDILDVNTAPKLDEIIAGVYANEFSRICEEWECV